MVSLIKNQIIKHLSIFAKNLQPDQISLEVLGGTGELRNIVLNEDILAEKLELPPFLKIRQAECNRVKVKVPWTKLGTSPVRIFVDELTVVLELGHAKASESKKKTPMTTGYGFADRVIEGLSIKVNVLDISFQSDSFSGSLWLSPLVVESKSQLWKDVANLKKSRISDSTAHQVIFFKQVSWNLMKIQAFAHGEGSGERGQRLNSPLRLITQGGKCRIAIKKDSNDGSLLAGRIQTIFDDIHWVATLAEVRSAISFYKHILALANASSHQADENPFLVDYSAKTRSQRTLPTSQAIKSTIFKQFDVGQTSHHVYITKVHMTLIDDCINQKEYPENWNIESAAIQVTLDKISIDFYLQNLIADERRFWVRYNAPNQFTAFADSELQRHLTNLSIGLDPTARDRLNRLWSTLTSQSLVVRIEDISVECVSDQSTKRDDLQDVYTSKTSAKFTMPESLPAFHLEFSNYYFPGSTQPEPPTGLAHGVLGPANVLIDTRTIRWLLYVVNNINQTLDIDESTTDVPIVCARVDLVLPKLIIPCPVIEIDHNYPRRFVVNVSTVTVSNRTLENQTFSIENLFQQLSEENLNFITSVDGHGTQELYNHVLQSKHLAAELATVGASMDLLPTRWYISTSPIWMEAVVPLPDMPAKSLHGVTVLSDMMLAGCIEIRLPNILVALEPLNNLSVVVDHYQFIQLMRVQKDISDLVEQLEMDKKFFTKIKGTPAPDVPLALYCFCNEINVHLVLPVGLAPSPYDAISIVQSETMTTLSSETSPEKADDVAAMAAALLEAPAPSPTASPVPPAVPMIVIPPPVVQTRDVDFTDFGSNHAISDELASNLDESMSMISDDDSQTPIELATPLGDDIFPETAEEAIEVNDVQMSRRQLKMLEKSVNALSASLSNFNVVVSSNNGKSVVAGYGAAIAIAQDLNVPLKSIFDKHRPPSTVMADKAVNVALANAAISNGETEYPNSQLQFRITGQGVGTEKYTHVVAKLRELNIALDEQIVSYLGAFVRDDNQEEEPLFLELQIENSNIQIVNPKKKNPLRITLGSLAIVDGAPPRQN